MTTPLLKLPPLQGAGAVVILEEVEVEEVVVVVAEAKTPTTRIKIKIIIRLLPTQTPMPNHIKREQSTQTYPLMLAGPVPSIGRKAEGHLIVATLWCASGCP